jgi:hypothetical protein
LVKHSAAKSRPVPWLVRSHGRGDLRGSGWSATRHLRGECERLQGASGGRRRAGAARLRPGPLPGWQPQRDSNPCLYLERVAPGPPAVLSDGRSRLGSGFLRQRAQACGTFAGDSVPQPVPQDLGLNVPLLMGERGCCSRPQARPSASHRHPPSADLSLGQPTRQEPDDRFPSWLFLRRDPPGCVASNDMLAPGCGRPVLGLPRAGRPPSRGPPRSGGAPLDDQRAERVVLAANELMGAPPAGSTGNQR